MKCTGCHWECILRNGEKEFFTPQGEKQIVCEYWECPNCQEHFCTPEQLDEVRAKI